MKEIVVKKRNKAGRCSNLGCLREANGRKFCGSCRARQSRLADPIRYAYNNLKNRAKQRGKEFTITIEEFTEFCHRTEYIKGKGKTIGSFNVDRIREEEGYTIDNIQCLDKQKNIRKYCAYDAERRSLKACAQPETPHVPEDDLPF